MNDEDKIGAWWCFGRVDDFQPKGHGFDSQCSRHVGTLGKSSLTVAFALRHETPIQYPLGLYRIFASYSLWGRIVGYVTSGRRRLGAAVWARGHLGASRLGAGRLGAVIVLLQNIKSGSELNNYWNISVD